MTADGGILVRMAQMLSPVAMSEEQMLEERESVVKEVGSETGGAVYRCRQIYDVLVVRFQ